MLTITVRYLLLFFFSSRRRHTRLQGDWSSDVCSSDLPTSRPCTETYLHMHYALQAHGVKPSDDLIWVGHSAGGQIGLTMAHLAKNHDKFPELAKKKAPAYHFDMVITLGAPIGAYVLPEDVKLRHYF